MDGRPRPTSGCPSVLRLPDVHKESETPSTSGEGERKFTESFLRSNNWNIHFPSFLFFLTYNMQNFLWKEFFLRVFYCLRAGAAKPENFTYFFVTVFIFFSILNIYKKEVMPMQGKDDSNKRIAELQKMRRSDYAKTWIGRRRIKIEIEKIKKSMR